MVALSDKSPKSGSHFTPKRRGSFLCQFSMHLDKLHAVFAFPRPSDKPTTRHFQFLCPAHFSREIRTLQACAALGEVLRRLVVVGVVVVVIVVVCNSSNTLVRGLKSVVQFVWRPADCMEMVSGHRSLPATIP